MQTQLEHHRQTAKAVHLMLNSSRVVAKQAKQIGVLLKETDAEVKQSRQDAVRTRRVLRNGQGGEPGTVRRVRQWIELDLEDKEKSRDRGINAWIRMAAAESVYKEYALNISRACIAQSTWCSCRTTRAFFRT